MVTIEEARQHLRIDGDYDDDWLDMMIVAISQAVLLWLKDETRAYELETDSNGDVIYDSDGDPVIETDSNGPVAKPIVKAAVLVELASQYRFRDGDGVAQVPAHWGHGYTLSAGSTALLTPLRKTTMA